MGNGLVQRLGFRTLPLDFQWQKNGTNLTDGGNVSGSLTTNLVLTNVNFNDAAIIPSSSLVRRLRQRHQQQCHVDGGFAHCVQPQASSSLTEARLV